jgi:hypothetical protein
MDRALAAGNFKRPCPIEFDPKAALIDDRCKILDITATSFRR